MSNLILPGDSRNPHNNFKVMYGSAQNAQSKQWEPAMQIERKGVTNGRIAGPIGMSEAHKFLDDSYAVQRCTELADHLYGQDDYIQSELFALVTVVTDALIDLLHMPETQPEYTGADFANDLDRSSAVILINGEMVLDAR